MQFLLYKNQEEIIYYDIYFNLELKQNDIEGNKSGINITEY